MLAVNYTELRGNMKKCMDKVSDDFETLIVTRKKNKNIVMISEETYNNMMENMHLMGNDIVVKSRFCCNFLYSGCEYLTNCFHSRPAMIHTDNFNMSIHLSFPPVQLLLAS